MLHSPALLLVDMQNEFAHPQGKLFVPGAPETVSPLAAVLRAFRQAGRPVIHVRREHRPDGSDVETVRRQRFHDMGGFCLPGSWGAQFIPELSPISGEIVIVKRAWSAFLNTELYKRLREIGVDTLVIGGAQTPNCVRATLYDATALGYEVILLGDGTSAACPEVQEANLRDLAALGVPILSCAEVIARLIPEGRPGTPLPA